MTNALYNGYIYYKYSINKTNKRNIMCNKYRKIYFRSRLTTKGTKCKLTHAKMG